MGTEIASKAEPHIHGLGQLSWPGNDAHNARNAVTTNAPVSPPCTSRALLHGGGARDRLPSPPTSNTPPPAPSLKYHNGSPLGVQRLPLFLRSPRLPGRSLHVALAHLVLPGGALASPRGTLRIEHLPHRPPPYAIAGTTTTATSVLAQAASYPTTSTSTSATPAYPSSTSPLSTYPASSAYAAPPTAQQQQQHHAQQRPTLIIPSSGATTTFSATNSDSTSFHMTPSGPAYRAASYTSFGSAVFVGRVGWEWCAIHGEREQWWIHEHELAVGEVWCDVVGWGEGAGAAVPSRERVYGGGGGSPRQRQYATPTPAPVNGSTAQYAPGSSTTPYTPGTASPTLQYATPRTLTARYEYLGRQAQSAGQGMVGQQDLSTPSRRHPCRPRPHPRAPPQGEEGEEEEEEEEEEGYDAPAYTERTTPPTSRRHHRRCRLRTALRAPTDDVLLLARVHRVGRQVRVGRGGWGDGGASKLAHIDRHTRAAPQHADHHVAGSSSDTQRSNGDTRAWAAEQARRMRRLCIVPADPSAHAYRPQQQSQQPQPQYGCVGGGGRVRGAVGRAERADVACAGGGAVAAEVSGSGAEDGDVSGWGTAAAADAPDAARDAPGTATPATGAPAAAHTAAARAHDDDAVDTPAPRVRGGRARAVDAATATLEWWSPGVGEVVPPHAAQAPQVPSHAPQVASHGLAPPAHTHVPSHTVPQLAPLAQAPMPRRAVFANADPPGVSGYVYVY
ncbi:hypothetical protein C8J57DRAFT_1730852 [Mycena rebaudengoi]|nr:hypothetical protein C8J57DRAFT_1730852 [Mycena rebaudengoi]